MLVDTRTDRPVRLAFVGEDGEEVDVAQVDSILGPGYYAWKAQAPDGGGD
ncbi:hypothetical protein [Streptomyces odonnellii]|nr:hypothetical protein [Streptomyces odonnellii]